MRQIIGMNRMSMAVFMMLAGAAALATEVVDSTGQENFQRLCAACHGLTGKGDGPVAGVLATTVPNLTTIAERNGGVFPRQIIKKLIDGRWTIDAHGTRRMPVWGYEFWIAEGAGDFSEMRVSKILDDLVNYLVSIQVEPTV
jgi:mono/diheme cytochrome c family protein